MADETIRNADSAESNEEQTVEKDQVSETSGREAQVPVIGIGASAGGLEAVSNFLEKMPDDTGAAFVVVQHLAPTKDSSMPELLSRHTRMPVCQVSDNMEIKSNTVYSLPPDKNMSAVNGKLQLLDPVRSPGIRHPIDFFFKSLAADLGRNAICIIMSGTGTDGTEGARMIKAELGLVIAQDPQEAKYDGMPRSVIDAGLADHILRVADIPDQAIKYLKQVPQINTASGGSDDLVGLLPKIISLIRDKTGNDFSAYKENTLLRRIARRMAIHHINDAAQYVRFLQEDPKESATLFKELLINVTSFFRDKDSFEALKSVLKNALKHKPGNEEIRAWVIGCSTGEEAYSIAIILRELLGELGKDNKVQIFATDLDSEAVDIARSGVYRKNIADDITPERLKRFFSWKDDGYQANANMREMLVFANHNLAKEPPFLRMDLISVRNLLIYLKGDLQKKLIPLFHYSLRENGILFLSPSETVGEFRDLFDEVDRKSKIYRCKPSQGVHVQHFPPLQPVQGAGQSRIQEVKPNETLQVAEAIVLSDYAPPFVVLDGTDNVIYFRGDTNRYLKLPEGKVTMNIVELARHGLASHVDLAIRSARRQKAEARRDNITYYADTADEPMVDILVRPLPAQNQGTECLMVVFKESSRRETLPIESTQEKDGRTRKRGKLSEKDRHILELEHELKRKREDLQATMEEMETSNEELKSANEELLSSNEELQSSNEELETSREELRSVNEELSGLNAENREKIEQLNHARDEMRNLLDATDVATVFLDLDLNIRGSTPASNRLFGIRKSDIGRPLSEISSALDDGGFFEDIHSVLRNLGKVEKEVRTKDDRWYLMRIVPFRSEENEIRGVLITFLDIDERRILEAALRYTQNIVDTVREPMLVLDKDLRVLSANRSFYASFRATEADTVGEHVYDLGNRQWNIPKLRNLLEEVIPKNTQFNNYPVELDFPLIGRRRMLLNARRLYDELGSQRVLLAIEDVTGQPFTGPLFTEHRPEEGTKDDE